MIIVSQDKKECKFISWIYTKNYGVPERVKSKK